MSSARMYAAGLRPGRKTVEAREAGRRNAPAVP
jgi:hypothetical protein